MAQRRAKRLDMGPEIKEPMVLKDVAHRRDGVDGMELNPIGPIALAKVSPHVDELLRACPLAQLII